MTHAMPPELLSPEDRKAQAAWLRHRIGAGWLRYVVLEAIFLGIPAVALLVGFVTEAVSQTTMIVTIVLLFLADAVFTVYWVRRMKPLSSELEALEQFTTE